MELSEKLKKICDEAVETEYLAGLNVLVVKDGREVAYAESGYIDRENKVPVKRDSIFRLYSLSKPITATAAMILLERGVISLQDEVASYLPTFRDTKVLEDGKLVPMRRALTVRDLLSMQSGIPYGSDQNDSARAVQKITDVLQEKTDTPEQPGTVEFAEQLGTCPLTFQPGERFMYGFGADVMGAVIEKASGMRFGDFLEQEIFRPLHMKDTGFYVPEEKLSRKTRTYSGTKEGGLVYDPTVHLGISHDFKCRPNFESGGAGLVSTIEDMKRFAGMLMNSGKLHDARILQPETVRHMCSSQLLPWQLESFNREFYHLSGYGYGNFMRVMLDPGQSYFIGRKGEYGWDGWLGCYMANLPEEKITILSMQQRTGAGTDPVTGRLRNAALSTLL